MGREGHVEITYHHFRKTPDKFYVVLRTSYLLEQYNHMAMYSNKTYTGALVGMEKWPDDIYEHHSDQQNVSGMHWPSQQGIQLKETRLCLFTTIFHI